ncbi:MAG: hypothetical protein ACYDHH_02955 [Solirubrobacteraceae bacterium]
MTAASTGNNAMAQCSLTTRLASGKRVAVLANVNTGASPYFVLERTIVEANQQFTPVARRQLVASTWVILLSY